MTTSSENARWVDPARMACLCKHGAPGFVVVVAVEPDGEESLWMCREELLGLDGVDHGNPYPRHELVGRLPRDVRERIWDDQLRCGRPRSNGQPCRHKIAEPGGACGLHRGQPVDEDAS